MEKSYDGELSVSFQGAAVFSTITYASRGIE